MDTSIDYALSKVERGTSTYNDAVFLRRYIESLEARLAPFVGPGRVKQIVFVPDGPCSQQGGCDCEPLTD